MSMSSEATPRTHTSSTSTTAASAAPASPMLPPDSPAQQTKSPTQQSKNELDLIFSTPTSHSKVVKTVDISSSKQMPDINFATSGITITSTTTAATSTSASKSHLDPAIKTTNSDASSGADYYSADENGNHIKDDNGAAANDSPFSLQDALASSSALVGENVLDSPCSPSAKVISDRGARRSAGMEHSSLLVPTLLQTTDTSNTDTNTNTTTTTATSNSYANTAAVAARRAKAAAAFSSAEDESVGMMAQGLAWARRQREHRRRLYLQNQAEQQLAKIQQAQAAEKKEQSAVIANRGLLDNSTFASLAKSMSPPFAVISGGASCGGSGDADDEYIDEQDFDGNYCSDNKYSLKTDRQFARDRGSDAAISKSGAGYTVKLTVSDEEPEEEEASWIPPVRVAPEPELERHPYILLEHHMQQIAVHVLPRGIAYCQWKRHYSLARDGDSFEACLRLIHGARRTLLVVRTSRNAIFGGFADMPWEPQSAGGAVYFGGPNACLFKVEPINQTNNHTTDNADDSHTDDTESDDAQSDRVKYYKWSGANRYIQLCDMTHKMLAFGGGGEEGAFGLCVEKDFERGSTGPCATFDNEPLCEQEDFEIVDMEIFGFLVGQF